MSIVDDNNNFDRVLLQHESPNNPTKRSWRWQWPLLTITFIVSLIVITMLVNIHFSSSHKNLQQSINNENIYSSTKHQTFISNTEPRRDIHGNIMDIHDGNILFYNNLYYYYGTGYGKCIEINSTSGCDGAVFGESCGFHYNHNLSLFTSNDLMTWTPAPEPPFQIARDFPLPNIVMFCTKVIYNINTKKFILWFNWNTNKGFIGVAESISPFGPFKVVNQQINTLERDWPSDFGLYQDEETGDGFVIYSGQNIVNIESVTRDFYETLGAVNSSQQIGPTYVEAPAMFKRNNLYYASTGAECCYCQQGSAAVLYVASHPLGPYSNITVLSANAKSQQTDITKYYDSDGNEHFIYRGDMWQQSPDHLKAHDPTYFGLIHWVNDIPQPLIYQANFTLDVGIKN